ncbi:protease modulator HflK family protein [bacterium]|nr:protease modulator HflK family protein [bacterium]
MNTKEKTAFISTALNVGLTSAKFILYYFTGSIAILAEACHSFSDIATSLIVYLAVHFQKNRKECSRDITLEHFVSLGIGIFLFIVSISLLYKVFTSPDLILQGTIISGVLFFLFSAGSYFVYKFETSVGREEKSVALISDGLHSKADMAGAFLTGFSLILYRLGINIDKPTAFLIALFILSFSAESIIHFINPRIRRDPQMITQYRSYKLIASALNSDFIDKVKEAAYFHFKKPINRHPGIYNTLRRYYLLLIFSPLIIWYISTCFVVLGPREEGIKLRFGKAVDMPLQPGLHIKIPWPIEKVVSLNTHEIRQIHIGNISDNKSFALLWTNEHGTGEPFLSGDNNYFHPYLTIHYRISNIFDFVFLHNDPEQALDSVTHRVITRLFAVNEFYDIGTKFRTRLIDEIHRLVQEESDAMRLGVELLSVNMKDTHPPIIVADSFEKVIAAYQEKMQMVNAAYGYRNQRLPEARGESARRIAKAEAYTSEREYYAQGDALRFLEKLETWEIHEETNKFNFYLRGMKDALKDKELIIIDPKAGKPQMWMGFTDIPGYSGLIRDQEKAKTNVK